jgi:hypothetical protein
MMYAWKTHLSLQKVFDVLFDIYYVYVMMLWSLNNIIGGLFDIPL